MLNALASKWWILLVNGLCAILFGILAFAWPGTTLFVLICIYGVYSIIDGISAIAMSGTRHENGKPWGRMLFVGIAGIAAGIIAFAWPGITAMVLLFVIAIWAIVRGVLEIVAAIEMRKVIQNEWLLALAGVASVLFGLFLMLRPGAGALAVIWVIGTFALLRGLLLVALSFRVRALGQLAPAISAARAAR